MRISRKTCRDRWDNDCMDLNACLEPETWDADCLPPRLRERIRAMAKADMRNFASAMVRLLDLGLEVWEEEASVLRDYQRRANGGTNIRPGAARDVGKIIPFFAKR